MDKEAAGMERETVERAVREAGGIVHRDGNIFFTDYRKMQAAMALAQQPAAQAAGPSGEAVAWKDASASQPLAGEHVLVAAEFGPNDWRIKIGGIAAETGDWRVIGASWRPSHWAPLPKPPGAAPQPSAQQAEQRDYRKELAEALGYPDGLRGGKPIGLAWELLIGYVKDMREYAERMERRAEQPAEEALGPNPYCGGSGHKDDVKAATGMQEPWGYWLRDHITGECLAYMRGRPVDLASDSRWRPLYTVPQAATAAQEPVGYVNANQLAQMSDRFPALIYPTADDFSKVAVYTAPQAASSAEAAGDEVQTLRAVAAEYDALIRHMDAGGDFHAFHRAALTVSRKGEA